MASALDRALKHFGEEVFKLRTSSGLSQSELAIRARLSLRSLQNWEGGKSEFRPRPKTIVLLANALGLSPIAWLTALGYSEITEEKIRDIGKSVGITFNNSIDPNDYFGEIESRVENCKPLLCITFLTRGGLSQSRSIQTTISRLIDEHDLAVAIIIPHPRLNLVETNKTSIANYYRAIYSDAFEFAKDIQLGIQDNSKIANLGLFCPVSSDFFVSPHVSHSYVRSTLLYINEENRNSYELGVWSTTRHNNKDNWLRMFPDPEGMTPNDAEDLLRYWKSYLQEIIEDWYLSRTKNTFGFWHKEAL